MAENNVPAPIPVPVAFLVCDQISVDVTTSKKTIVGVFSHIWANRFPTNHAPTNLYVKLIDCEGEYEFIVEFVQVSSQEKIFEGGGTVSHKSRHEYTELVLQNPPLLLPEPGEYEFRLWMNDKFISSVRVIAQLLSEMEAPK